MRLADFDYQLPEELIAQVPAEHRDDSRLMILERASGRIRSTGFRDIVNDFRSGDLLVVNDTRVIPARLLGRKATGGKVELFLARRHLQEAAYQDWLCLSKSSRPLRPGTIVEFAEGMQAEVGERVSESYLRVRFLWSGDFMALVERIGELPLPPYIKRAPDNQDRERYQTVFASQQGAVAAPTAALHFTPEILAQLRIKGVEIHALTLHVGLGTFLPVRVDDVRNHRMHSEYYAISQVTAEAVNRARDQGRRVIALGTTSARALETAASSDGRLVAGQGDSDIFIYPGYRFSLVDGLVTNFHLPKSTLLMLVSAFAGREFVLQAYRQAVAEHFRFFSYGDCMLIV